MQPSGSEISHHPPQLNTVLFINADGDEVDLVKSDNAPALQKGEYTGAKNLNQKRKIKADSVLMCNGKRLHAYTQVNPTSYKVYHQTPMMTA